MRVSPHLLKLTIYSVGLGGQLSRVFDLRPQPYLEHWGYEYFLEEHNLSYFYVNNTLFCLA